MIANKSLGWWFLVGFLVVYGLLAITNLQFALAVPVLGVLAFAAGVLIAIGK